MLLLRNRGLHKLCASQSYGIADPSVDDSSTGRGVVLGRAATKLRSIETQPLTGGSTSRRLVRYAYVLTFQRTRLHRPPCVGITMLLCPRYRLDRYSWGTLLRLLTDAVMCQLFNLPVGICESKWLDIGCKVSTEFSECWKGDFQGETVGC